MYKNVIISNPNVIIDLILIDSIKSICTNRESNSNISFGKAQS